MRETILIDYLQDCLISFQCFKKFLSKNGHTFTETENGEFFYYVSDILQFLKDHIKKQKQ